MNVDTLKSSVQEQFNRCAHHYLSNSPMANRDLLGLIVQLAAPAPSAHVLDVCCGAGFLLCEFAPCVEKGVGVDLSEAMLTEASRSAQGLANVSFDWADAESLPFADESFDIVTCKLALHYFPKPQRAIGEMRRVAKRGGRVVLIDRISSDDNRKQEFQNRIEKLRTPSKVKIYSQSEIAQIIEAGGLMINRVQSYEQHQAAEEWLQTTGAAPENQRRARDLMTRCLKDDQAGWNVRWEDGKLLMTHSTAIFVAERP